MWVNQLDFITNLGIFLLWLLLALSMVSTVSMVETTIGRVVSNLVESGLVAFIGCWKDSGSDTLILVTRTCQPLLSLSMIKDCHSRLGDSHSVTDHWQDVFKKQFCHVSSFFKRQQQPLGGSCSVCQSARQLASWRSCKWESGRVAGSRQLSAFLPHRETGGSHCCW